MRVLREHIGPVLCLAYAPGDPATLAVGNADGSVTLWNPLTGRCRDIFRTSLRSVLSLAFAPDGNLLAIGGEGVPDSHGRIAPVSLWDLSPGGEQRLLWLSISRVASSLAFSHDGKLLAVACPPLTPNSVRTALAVFRRTFAGLVGPDENLWPGGTRRLTFSPDGNLLAVAGMSNWNVELRDMSAGEGQRRATLHFQGQIQALAFSPGGDPAQRVLAVAAGRFVELRDGGGRKRSALKGHTSLVRALAFSPDGRTLLTGGGDGTVRLWDLATGQETACLNWGLGPVQAVAFAPDGMTAAASGDSAEVMIWDVDVS
jgi:WD40 repeat protein